MIIIIVIIIIIIIVIIIMIIIIERSLTTCTACIRVAWNFTQNLCVYAILS